MSKRSYCPDGGWLVSEAPVPDDPSDHWTHGVGDVFGCNHLVCRTCGADVRSIAQRGPAKALGAEQLGELANTEDWSDSTLLKKAYFQRFYACRCKSYVETERRLVQDEDRDPCDVVLPWSCGGHPMTTLPVEAEGLTLSSDTNWDAVVRQVFDGTGPGGDPVSWNELPASWLSRLYFRLRRLPEAAPCRERSPRSVSDRPEDVGGALLFFRWWPHAAGGERVIDLADRAGGTTVCLPLRDISTPESPAITLGAQARLGHGGPSAAGPPPRRGGVRRGRDRGWGPVRAPRAGARSPRSRLARPPRARRGGSQPPPRDHPADRPSSPG